MYIAKRKPRLVSRRPLSDTTTLLASPSSPWTVIGTNLRCWSRKAIGRGDRFVFVAGHPSVARLVFEAVLSIAGHFKLVDLALVVHYGKRHEFACIILFNSGNDAGEQIFGMRGRCNDTGRDQRRDQAPR